MDGIGNGIGYGIILILVAMIREFFGKGTLLGYKLLGPTSDFLLTIPGYQPNNLMVLFPSAMFVIGILIWIHRAWNRSLIDIS